MYISDHTYVEKHRVHTHHCDTFFTARLPYYFQLVQEGAATHAMLRGCSNPDFGKIGKAWVLSKIKIHINSYIPWSEYIQLETWIQPPLRFFAPREARGIDEQGNELFRVMVYWVIIDIESRRPERAEQYLEHIGLAEDRSLWSDTKLGKVPKMPAGNDFLSFKPQIQYRDIDSVRHVNNISYVEWILESMGPEYQDGWNAEEFEINFTAESFFGDSLEIRSYQTGDADWLHAVIKHTPEGEIETCRAKSRWIPRGSIT